MKIKKLFLFISIITFLGIGVYFHQQYYSRYRKAKHERLLLYEARKIAWQELEQRIKNELGQFKGEAGIVIKDLETGWELSYDKTKLFPAASLAKIPLMAACFLTSDYGKIKLDRIIALKSSDKLTGSGALKNMPAGTTFSVERLIGLMIYDSDNTATNIVTDLIGVDYLNSMFKVFGLKNTDLSRKIADYKSRDQGIENYTTAEDMSLLLDKIYKRNLGNKNVSDQCISILKLTRINDRIPKYLPVDITIAHKTGTEKEVSHDVGIVFTKKGDFIICVLTKYTNHDIRLAKEFISKVAFHAYSYICDRP